MIKYLAGVLTVLTAGVLLIAYGLLAPRAAASPMPFAQDPYGVSTPAMQVGATPVSYVRSTPSGDIVELAQPPARRIVRTSTVRSSLARAPKRDWKKTALVIGGSSATGAGIGALVGGSKGALIGAAIGGGGSTLFTALK